MEGNACLGRGGDRRYCGRHWRGDLCFAERIVIVKTDASSAGVGIVAAEVGIVDAASSREWSLEMSTAGSLPAAPGAATGASAYRQ